MTEGNRKSCCQRLMLWAGVTWVRLRMQQNAWQRIRMSFRIHGGGSWLRLLAVQPSEADV